MKVIFLKVEYSLCSPEAKAPDGTDGISEANVKKLRKLVVESGSRIVLFGDWKKHWDFDDAKCTLKGMYLNRKLHRRGLHILDKTADKETPAYEIQDWLNRHPNVTEYTIWSGEEELEWMEL